MLARCARCQGTFTTDRFGRQFCPHCGSELDLADPSAAPQGGTAQPPGAPPPGPPSQPAPPEGGAPPPPAPPAGGWGASGGGTPPGGHGGPPAGGWGAPPGGYGPPPGGWGPPPGGYGAPPGGYGPPPGYGPPGGYGYPPPPPEPELPAPFAERDRRGFLRSYFETWKLAAVEPQRFFRRVRVDQYWSAVLFAVISYAAGAIVSGLYNLALTGRNAAAMAEALDKLPPEAPAWMRQAIEAAGKMSVGPGLAVTTVFSPVWGFVAVFLAAGITHLFLMLFRGAARGFAATLTVYGYSYGLYLLLAIPGCGGIIALVWQLVVVIMGLAQAQRCGTGKSLAAVLAPVILVSVCCCAAMLAGILGAMGTVGHGGTTTL